VAGGKESFPAKSSFIFFLFHFFIAPRLPSPESFAPNLQVTLKVGRETCRTDTGFFDNFLILSGGCSSLKALKEGGEMVERDNTL
jgi:hypothetical protein